MKAIMLCAAVWFLVFKNCCMQIVWHVKKMSMPLADTMKRKRRPSLSHMKAAKTAQKKFHMARMPLMSSCNFNGRLLDNRKQTIQDTYLSGRVGNADGIEHIFQVIRDQTIARPL